MICLVSLIATVA